MFLDHKVIHILIRACIVSCSSTVLFLGFVPGPSRSLPPLARLPWFSFSANLLASFRSYRQECPVWVLFHPFCTRVPLTLCTLLPLLSLCHFPFPGRKFPTTSSLFVKTLIVSPFSPFYFLLPFLYHLALSCPIVPQFMHHF